MTVRSRFHQVDRDIENNIVYIEDDCDLYGGSVMSVTNDAENVVKLFRSLLGNEIRIVYLDTDKEWWEIAWSFDGDIEFRRWNGIAWDILQR